MLTTSTLPDGRGDVEDAAELIRRPIIDVLQQVMYTHDAEKLSFMVLPIAAISKTKGEKGSAAVTPLLAIHISAFRHDRSGHTLIHRDQAACYAMGCATCGERILRYDGPMVHAGTHVIIPR